MTCQVSLVSELVSVSLFFGGSCSVKWSKDLSINGACNGVAKSQSEYKMSGTLNNIWAMEMKLLDFSPLDFVSPAPLPLPQRDFQSSCLLNQTRARQRIEKMSWEKNDTTFDGDREWRVVRIAKLSNLFVRLFRVDLLIYREFFQARGKCRFSISIAIDKKTSEWNSNGKRLLENSKELEYGEDDEEIRWICINWATEGILLWSLIEAFERSKTASNSQYFQ